MIKYFEMLRFFLAIQRQVLFVALERVHAGNIVQNALVADMCTIGQNARNGRGRNLGLLRNVINRYFFSRLCITHTGSLFLFPPVVMKWVSCNLFSYVSLYLNLAAFSIRKNRNEFFGKHYADFTGTEAEKSAKMQNKKIIPANCRSNPEDAKKAERPPHR